MQPPAPQPQPPPALADGAMSPTSQAKEGRSLAAERPSMGRAIARRAGSPQLGQALGWSLSLMADHSLKMPWSAQSYV
jgi:hypothetical protein